MNTYYSILPSPVSDLLLIANESELIGIYFDACDYIATAKKQWTHNERHPVLQETTKQLKEYFAGKRTTFSVPMNLAGTDFQKRVWREIARIPFGETVSYSELAHKAGAPDAVRAAGASTGKNPIAIIVPCHRVIGKNGAITGYAGGLERKQYLMELENSAHKLTKKGKSVASKKQLSLI